MRIRIASLVCCALLAAAEIASASSSLAPTGLLGRVARLREQLAPSSQPTGNAHPIEPARRLIAQWHALRAQAWRLPAASRAEVLRGLAELEPAIQALHTNPHPESAARPDPKRSESPALFQGPGAPPPNDTCLLAPPITKGTPPTGSTLFATNDGSATCGSSATSPDVWYRYVPTEDEDLAVSTFTSGYDTVLSVHTDCPGTAENQLACSDDYYYYYASRFVFAATALTPYYIRIAGYNGSTGNYALQLQAVASISGKLTDESSGAPLAEAYVDLVDKDGYYVESAETDADGNYKLGDLFPTSYYLVTYSPGHIDEVYDNKPCPGYCYPDEIGTPVTLAQGERRTGINFALAKPATIAGRVLAADTGQAISAGIDINIYDAVGDWVGGDWVYGGTGEYKSSALPAGTYHVATSTWSYNWDDHLDQLYMGLPCESECDVTAGTPVSLAAGQALTGIDFNLPQGGKITGSVNNALGTGVYSTVKLYAADGTFLRETSNYGGTYSFRRLATGTYLVMTQNSYGLIDQVWNHKICSGACDPLTGTPVAVTLGAVTANIDFLLEGPPASYYTVAPCRILDSRDPFQAGLYFGYSYGFAFGSDCGVPSSAVAVALNITVTDADLPGTLRLWPYGSSVPTASALSFRAHRPASGNGVYPVGGYSEIDFTAEASSWGTYELIVDVTGYFQP